jgi:predicted acyltransferase
MMSALKTHCQSIYQNLPAKRLLALDVFRGMTITAMILVNNPGSWQHIYPPLEHAKWHGWTLTDLIFPFFIFIVGVSISLSGQRQREQGLGHAHIIRHALLRMLKLLLLGFFLALFYYNFSAANYDWFTERLMQIRFMGVLQRIAVVYFACVLLWMFLSRLQLLVCMLMILVVYWLAMAFIPYHDDVGNQYVGLLDYANNLSAWLDSRLFAKTHLYYASAQPFAFDPEGVFSTLPAIASGLSGVLAGQWLLLSHYSMGHKAKWLAICGVVALLLGQVWANWLPINKALWTSSYVLLTSGYAALALAGLMYVLDIKQWRLWAAPFLVFGANSIAFFMFAGVVGRLVIMFHIGEVSVKSWLYTHIYQPWLGDLNGSLAYAFSFLLLSYVVMFVMYRKHIFWKV